MAGGIIFLHETASSDCHAAAAQWRTLAHNGALFSVRHAPFPVRLNRTIPLTPAALRRLPPFSAAFRRVSLFPGHFRNDKSTTLVRAARSQ
jgi:hypothetical protein